MIGGKTDLPWRSVKFVKKVGNRRRFAAVVATVATNNTVATTIVVDDTVDVVDVSATVVSLPPFL